MPSNCFKGERKKGKIQSGRLMCHEIFIILIAIIRGQQTAAFFH